MYICEKCGKEVFEKYGSGRFCSQFCARGFSNYKGVYEYRKNLPIHCNFCKEKFSNISGLKTHLKRKHNDDYLKNKVILHYNKLKIELNINIKDLEEYRQKQQTCEICGKHINEIKTEKNQFKQLCIDHDHQTKKFRGLLCISCNRMLGWYENNNKKIKKYLDKLL